jgi:hypothetical protein
VPLLLAAVPASAEITSGTGCFGDATIRGTTYTQDQSQKSAILMPEEDAPAEDLVVPYNGNVTFNNRNCTGFYLIEFEGNPIESPVTIVGIVGAGFTAALVVVSGRRRPGLGDIGDLGAMQ